MTYYREDKLTGCNDHFDFELKGENTGDVERGKYVDSKECIALRAFTA